MYNNSILYSVAYLRHGEISYGSQMTDPQAQYISYKYTIYQFLGLILLNSYIFDSVQILLPIRYSQDLISANYDTECQFTCIRYMY